ncbi:MAG: helix-turn-helix transcriptional regulator [Candidatus Pacebacteria bacterium]|nr:helix-turn-helix transcriptional regulator [Candidatus Paceibacterota bacterium]
MSAKNMFYKENFNFSNSEEKAFAREELVYNVTEDLLVILEDMEINKKELARRLGKSRSYVSQILSGSRNMTLGSFSDICFALEFKPEIKLPVQKKPENDIQQSIEYEKKWVSQSRTTVNYSGIIRSNENIIDRTDKIYWAKVA